MAAIVERLLASPEPSIRFLTLTGVLGRDAGDPEVAGLREEIRTSPRVRQLLAGRETDVRRHPHPYSKWRGSHWVLAALADIGYPEGDESLIPLREPVLAWLLGESHTRAIKAIDGRVRRCASQEGNALWALLKLGLGDERTDCLAERLAGWQWADGGWNCDKRPQVTISSFMESLIPLRGLALHARLTGDERSRAAAERAADIFLKRRLFRGEHGGEVIHPDFVRLHYPPYWRYDILFGLKVMAEAGFIKDPRCAEALDLLASKRLPDGGFPAEGKFYRVSTRPGSGISPVEWGAVSKTRSNEWVTVNALAVLRAAGRKF